MKTNTIAIITARGGSKRLPRKNIRSFCGKPILSYSVTAALAADCFDEVMVSTDDEEIAAIARTYGATVPFMRSAATSDDFSTTSDVLREVLLAYREQGKAYAYFCCIYPTCPLLRPKRLREAMELLSDYDGVMPVAAFSFPPQRGLVIEKGLLRPRYPEYMQKRSQDLETMYHDAGQFYACRTEAFLTAGTLWMDNTYALLLSAMEVQDIDDEADWVLAEMKYKGAHSLRDVVHLHENNVENTGKST